MAKKARRSAARGSTAGSGPLARGDGGVRASASSSKPVAPRAAARANTTLEDAKAPALQGLPAAAGTADRPVPQAGAIPYRHRPDGSVQVLLITNRAGGWIVPKGRIDPGRSPEQTARIEAMEEAGVIGAAVGREVGYYDYEKLGRVWRVRLFAMPVQRVLDDWPEKHERKREWVSVDEAIARVAFDQLRDVLERFEAMEGAGAGEGER